MLPSNDHPIFKTLEKIQKAMLARDNAVLKDLVRTYARSMTSIRSLMNKLIDEIKKGDVSYLKLQQLGAYSQLFKGIEGEVTRIDKLVSGNLESSILKEIQHANADAMALVQKSLPGMSAAKLIGTWSVLSPRQVYTLYGFLAPEGALNSMLVHNFGSAVALHVRDLMLEGFVQGMNPREISRLIMKGYGDGLTWMLNTVRTANLWAYRTASHLNYLQNSHVVNAWMWYAQLDDRCCMSCVFQHGEIHPLSEVLADHHMGRCTALPVTASYAELGIIGVPDEKWADNVPRGEQWFKTLPAAKQLDMMGPAMYAAWKANAFQFDQLTKPYHDKIYGRMLRQASLKDILKDKAKIYYGK